MSKSLSDEVIQHLLNCKMLDGPGGGNDTARFTFEGLEVTGQELRRVVHKAINDQAGKEGYRLGAGDSRAWACSKAVQQVLCEEPELVAHILSFLPSLSSLLIPANGASASLIRLQMQDPELLWLIRRFLPHLQRLNISGCKHITDTPLFELLKDSAPPLRSLRLRNCVSVPGMTLASLFARHASSLQQVDIQGCRGSLDATLCYLASAPGGGGGGEEEEEGGRGSLEWLQAGGCALSDYALHRLALAAASLRTLNLCACRSVSDAALGFLLRHTPHLTHLHLADTPVADCTLASIAGTFPEADSGPCRALTALQVLDLSRCPHVNDGGLIPAVAACTGLQAISLSHNANATDDTLLQMAQSTPHMTRLILDHCPGVTDRGVIAAVEGLPRLLELDLQGNLAVTDSSLKAILTWSTRLRRLDLRGCHIIGQVDSSLRQLVGDKSLPLSGSLVQSAGL